MSTKTMDIISLFSRLHSHTFNEAGWFPHLGDALEGLSFKQAIQKPEGHAHSIWDILNHLIYWNEVYLGRFDEKHRTDQPRMDNDATFEQPELERTETNWKSLLQSAEQVFSSWQKVIEAATESKFEQQVSESDSSSWWQAISDMCLHNSYHLGQIITIRKWQTSWTNKY